MTRHATPLFQLFRPAILNGLAILAMAPPAAWSTPIGANGNGTSLTTYRCGNMYQSQPCEQGQALDFSDGRSPAQQAQARAAAQREHDQVSAQTRERLEREQREASRGPGIAGMGAAKTGPQTAQAGDCRIQNHHKKGKKPKPLEKDKSGQRCADDATLYRAPLDPAQVGKKSRGKTAGH
jgi:hypothetical protein